MPAPAISVENLSKCYLVGRRSDQRAYHGYAALRDIIGREISNTARKAIDVVRGLQVVRGHEVEEFWAFPLTGKKQLPLSPLVVLTLLFMFSPLALFRCACARFMPSPPQLQTEYDQ
jgi:hypothetical protein